MKTQMKCHIMWHFIRVYTVCKGKEDLQTKKTKMFVLNYNLYPLCARGYPKGIVSNQLDEPIGIQRVNVICMQHGLYESVWLLHITILYSNTYLRVFSVNTKKY